MLITDRTPGRKRSRVDESILRRVWTETTSGPAQTNRVERIVYLRDVHSALREPFVLYNFVVGFLHPSVRVVTL